MFTIAKVVQQFSEFNPQWLCSAEQCGFVFVICQNSVNSSVQKSQDHSADILEIPISAKGRPRKEKNTMGKGREEKKKKQMHQ